MASRLQAELKQNKPFNNAEQEALLSIARTAAVIDHRFTEILKPHGITPTQFNVLRILRGAGKDGHCRNEIRDRLVAQVPDVTRLLDRMEAAGLVERERDSVDRRMVNTHITREGERILARLDGQLDALQQQWAGPVGRQKLAQLIDTLADIRERI